MSIVVDGSVDPTGARFEAEERVVDRRVEVRRVDVRRVPGGPVGDDNFLGFLFGLKAEEAKSRYDLRLSKEDQNWIYIDILPRLPADKADFQRAQLVLTQNSFLPRRLWFEQPNGNEVYWDFTKLYTGVQLQPQEFQRPVPEPGWQLVPVDLPGAPGSGPRVIRQQN